MFIRGEKMKKEYWENRYKNNGNSGEGSHRKDLYTFKLNYIQNLVDDKQIDSKSFKNQF